MSPLLAAWIAVVTYALITGFIAVRGAMRTSDVEGYTVGGRDVPAALVGLALCAQLTSVATFVINPGLVFHSGVSALMGYGVAAALGVTLGLVVFSARFRSVGSQTAALTVPQWIGARFDAPRLRGLFAVLSMGLVAYAVLIVTALALVLAGLLGLPAPLLAIGVAAFAVATVALGGANGHAWTGAAQALVMLAVAVLMIAKGLPYLFSGELFAALEPAQRGVVNPESFYFRNAFEVFVCNFVVGVALVCQPHIASKALYLRDDRQVRTYLGVAIVAGMVFLGVLVVGLYAHAVVPAGTPIDRVVPAWIGASFGPLLQVAIAIGLLCAGMSTLEGILLALASTLSIDIHPTWCRLTGASPSGALRFGRLSLVAIGAVVVVLAHQQIADPTGGSVAIFAQYGVYLLFTGTFVPLACGMFVPKAGRGLVTIATAAALLTWGVVDFFELSAMSNNPAFLATCGMAAAWGVIGLGLAAATLSRPAAPSGSGWSPAESRRG